MTIAKKVTTKQPPNKKSENTTTKPTSKSGDSNQSTEATKKTVVKPDTPSKASRAMIIMEEQWENIQSGKVKRKDIIQRFISEVGLTPKGAVLILVIVRRN